jgi:hypothetical protein
VVLWNSTYRVTWEQLGGLWGMVTIRLTVLCVPAHQVPYPCHTDRLA